MNVYVITESYTYAGFEIRGIYSTRALAEEGVQILLKKGHGGIPTLDIEEWEVDADGI